MPPPPSSVSPLALYRNLVRAARSFQDYNVREYALRRVRSGFKENASTDAVQAELLMQKATKELRTMQRQATVYNLYAGGMKSVLETKGVA